MNTADKNYVASERGISYFGAFISIIMGYAAQNAMFIFSEVKAEEAPVLVIIALWFVFTTMFMVALDKVGV